MVARGWHGLIAVLACAAILVQIVIAVRVSGVPHEVTTGVLRGSSLPGRIIRVLSFFTIDSNVLSGIVSAQLAVRPDRDGPAWRALRLAALVGPQPRAGLRPLAWSLLFPVLWLAYTLVRGAIWKWYPYPFLDVTTHGYLRVVVNSLAVTVVLGVVAGMFALGDRWLPAVPRPRG